MTNRHDPAISQSPPIMANPEILATTAMVRGSLVPNRSAMTPANGATSISLRRRAAKMLPPSKIASSSETCSAHINEIDRVNTPSIPAPIQKIITSRLSGRGNRRSRFAGRFTVFGWAFSNRKNASNTARLEATAKYPKTVLGPTMVASQAPAVIARSGPICSTDRLRPILVPVLAGLIAAYDKVINNNAA